MEVVEDTIEPAAYEAPPAAVPARRNGRAPAPPRASTDPNSVQEQMTLRDNESVRDWMDSLVPDGELKVTISRKSPRIGPGGENIAGSLETVDDRIDEDYIRETWGGGDFQIAVMTQRANGQFKIFRRTQLKIAGPPKMHGRLVGEGGGPAIIAAAPEGAGSLAQRAFESMERREKEANERLLHQTPNHGLDSAALAAITGPILEQLKIAQMANAELQLKMLEGAQRPPQRDEFRDRMLEQAIGGDSQRIESLRAQYENRMAADRERLEARIDRLTESHEAAIKRLEDRHVDDIKRMEARHERELRQAEKQAEGSTKSTSIAFDSRIEAQKETIARLERELTASATKIATLEAKKDQTISEKADEILKVQEVLEGLGGGKDTESKWYEKVIDAVGNSEAALKVIGRFAGPAPNENVQTPQPQQPQLPPPGVPFQTGDGNVYVQDRHGNVTIIDPNQARAIAKARLKRKRAAAAAAQPGSPPVEGEASAEDLAPEPGPEPTMRAPDEKEMEIAVTFMENAVKSGADPEMFGSTARNLMPQDLLAYIMQFAQIDDFLSKCKLDPGSPLTTVRGRQFARAVHRYLRTGDSKEVTPGP